MSVKSSENEYQWVMTWDEVGVHPLFELDCKICSYHTLFLRHSMLFVQRLPKKAGMMLRAISAVLWKLVRWRMVVVSEVKVKHYVNRMAYKCPRCDWLVTFNVPLPEELFANTLELRKGDPLYYPDLEEWKKKDEMVRKKLEELNYV